MKKHEHLSNIGEAFGAKATRYRAHAHVQQRAMARLVRHFSLAELGGKVIVDIGAGTGLLAPTLRKTSNSFKIIGLDISFDALWEGKTHDRFDAGAIQADMTSLPLLHESVDAVVISSSAQWLSNPCASPKPAAQILKPGGLFAFGILLEGTLAHFHRVQRKFGIQPPVRYCTRDAYIDAVERAGLAIIHEEILTETDHYTNGFDFLRGLSAIGSTAHAGARLSRRELAVFAHACEPRTRTDDGVDAEYNYLLGIAHKSQSL